MKQCYLLFFLLVSLNFLAQKTDYNTINGFIADGYDVVSYFEHKKPLKGKIKYQTSFNEAKFQFSSEKNLLLFLENPEKYIPQYGGYCAYAIAKKKIKMEIDPESYEIRDGKLYLFYNAWFFNKLDNWQEEDTPKLQQQGDENWKELKYKKG